MTQNQLIIFLMFLLLLELLCMRYFWLRSEKDEEEIERLERKNKVLEAEIERKDLLLAEWEKWFNTSSASDHPCYGCGTAWGYANSEGAHLCYETCEKLIAWNEQRKKEADNGKNLVESGNVVIAL